MKNFRILMVLVAGFFAFGMVTSTVAYAGCGKAHKEKVCEKSKCDKPCMKKCEKKVCEKGADCGKCKEGKCDKPCMKKCEKSKCSKGKHGKKKCTKGMKKGATYPHNDPSRYND